MTEPPNINLHDVSPNEMQKMLSQPDCQASLSKCVPTRIPQPQGEMHDAFCCKKEIVLFTDTATGDEVAIAIEQTYRDPAKTTNFTVTQLRIGNDLYRLRIP
jgi:hypothetical protein